MQIYVYLTFFILSLKLSASDFIVDSKEQKQFKKCKTNMWRGSICKPFLEILCKRINNENAKCLESKVKKCHKENITYQTLSEAKCDDGPFKNFCYGVNSKCANESTCHTWPSIST